MPCRLLKRPSSSRCRFMTKMYSLAQDFLQTCFEVNSWANNNHSPVLAIVCDWCMLLWFTGAQWHAARVFASKCWLLE